MSMIDAGKAAPEFTLPSDEGKSVALSDFRGQFVVLYFYPKDDTPGCTKEACAFQDTMGALKRQRVTVLGVSTDSVESHQRFKAKYRLTFPLLSDADKKVLQAYGAWKEKSMYGRTFMGIQRMTYIIDPKGKVAKVFPNVRVDGHVEAVQAALQKVSDTFEAKSV